MNNYRNDLLKAINSNKITKHVIKEVDYPLYIKTMNGKDYVQYMDMFADATPEEDKTQEMSKFVPVMTYAVSVCLATPEGVILFSKEEVESTFTFEQINAIHTLIIGTEDGNDKTVENAKK